MAFTLVRPSSGTTWRIQQRYVNTGLDENVAARLWLNGTPTSLALVTDRQGGYIMGVRNTGTEETSTGFYLRNAFGKMESGSTAASSLETHLGVGFAGAGTPTNAAGGYVYLRNRWYDPGTGRFLSQDPIGLAGGVNLYAYAGNNPASYSDPFGLTACPEEAGGDGKTQRYDDCPKFSPGWFANRSATGQGNEALNTIGGVLSILGRHVSLSATAVDGTASVDAVGLAGGVPTGSLDATENYPAASLPQLGASLNITLGNVDDVGDQMYIGLGHHWGLTINFSAKTGHANGAVFNFGVATPQIPVTASRNTGDQLHLVPPVVPGIPGVNVKLP